MYPYMISENDENFYKKAFNHTLDILASKDPFEVAKNSGAVFDYSKSVFNLESLGQSLDIKFPEGRVYFSNSNHKPVWSWRLLVLNYLCRADNTPLYNKLISYRETEGGHIFFPAFQRESIKPLVDFFSDKPEGEIEKACLKFTPYLEGGADVAATFYFFPRFPVKIKIWLQDEELGGSANILFDASANNYLHTEDIAVAGNLVSYFLIKQYELMCQGDDSDDNV